MKELFNYLSKTKVPNPNVAVTLPEEDLTNGILGGVASSIEVIGPHANKVYVFNTGDYNVEKKSYSSIPFLTPIVAYANTNADIGYWSFDGAKAAVEEKFFLFGAIPDSKIELVLKSDSNYSEPQNCIKILKGWSKKTSEDRYSLIYYSFITLVEGELNTSAFLFSPGLSYLSAYKNGDPIPNDSTYVKKYDVTKYTFNNMISLRINNSKPGAERFMRSCFKLSDGQTYFSDDVIGITPGVTNEVKFYDVSNNQ